jgi:dipeptidyl-peptidase-4
MNKNALLFLGVFFPLALGGCPKPVSGPDLPPKLSAAKKSPRIKPLSLARLQADPPLAGRRPMRVKFSPAGERLSFLKGSEKDSEVLDLWAMDLPDGRPRVVVKTDDLVEVGKIALSEAERQQNERKRIRHRGITRYQYCGGPDALLFPLSGDLYHVTLPQRDVARLTDDGLPKLDPTCSPKGRFVSFVRAGELFVLEKKTGIERRITRGASDTLFHGLAEFVAQEEMDRHRGHFWLPDDSGLIYTQVDESPVSVKKRPRIYADRTDLVEQRYPAAGEDNAKLKLFFFSLGTGETRELALPKEDGYLARVHTDSPERISIQWHSRDQKSLRLFEFMLEGEKRLLLLEEKDPAYVPLHGNYRRLKDGTFLWSSDAEGINHLHLHSQDGKRLRTLTQGSDPLTRRLAVDEKRGVVYVVKATDRGLQRHLFEVALDGSGEKQITEKAGWHSITMARGATGFVDSHSDLGKAPRSTLRDLKNRKLLALGEEGPSPLDAFSAPVLEMVTVKAEDGTELNGVLYPPLLPPGEKGAPVIIYTYGGPTGQLVAKRWTRWHPFFMRLSQLGFGVFMLDNRGTGGRDRAFNRALFEKFGDVEVADQIAGARYLQSLPWVDKDRIGVFGWSYGGYLTAMLLGKTEGLFAAGASVAPVTEWRLYDTHYTERYLGMPQDNEALYDEAGVLKHAEGIVEPFLLMHGMADDNVLFENSLMLMEFLQNKSLPFELMTYPGRAHGLRGRATQLHVLRSLESFFVRHLKPGQ